MICEPILGQQETAEILSGVPQSQQFEALRFAREGRLMEYATRLAVHSALEHGRDLPIGAVASEGNTIIGRYVASDQRLGHPDMHAEFLAVAMTKLDRFRSGPPETITVTMEPCDDCQDFLSRTGVQNVVFNISRSEVEDRGLIRVHSEDIFDRAWLEGFPFRVVKFTPVAVTAINHALFDHASRDIETGQVSIDHRSLQKTLRALKAA